VKLTDVAYFMIRKMAADFLHEFKVVVFQFLIDRGVSAESNAVCDSRIN
jgi:hypothetical protein